MGVATESSADVGFNSLLTTAVYGGEFTDHLQRNAYFLGLPIGMEFGPRFLRSLAGKYSQKQLKRLQQFSMQSKPKIERFNYLCTENNVDPKTLLGSAESDWSRILGKISPAAANELRSLHREMFSLQQQWVGLINDTTHRGPYIGQQRVINGSENDREFRHGKEGRMENPTKNVRGLPQNPNQRNTLPDGEVPGVQGTGGGGSRSIERGNTDFRSGDTVGIVEGTVKDNSGKNVPGGTYIVEPSYNTQDEINKFVIVNKKGERFYLPSTTGLLNRSVTSTGWRSGEYIDVTRDSLGLPTETHRKICRVKKLDDGWYLEYKKKNTDTTTVVVRIGENALPPRSGQQKSQDALAVTFTGREIPRAPKAIQTQQTQPTAAVNTPQLRPALEISTPIIAPEHSGKLHKAIENCYKQYKEVFLVMRAKNGNEIRVRHRAELQISATRLKTIDDPKRPGQKMQVIAYQNEDPNAPPNSPEREYISEQYIVRVETPDGTVIYDATQHFGKPPKKP